MSRLFAHRAMGQTRRSRRAGSRRSLASPPDARFVGAAHEGRGQRGQHRQRLVDVGDDLHAGAAGQGEDRLRALRDWQEGLQHVVLALPLDLPHLEQGRSRSGEPVGLRQVARQVVRLGIAARATDAHATAAAEYEHALEAGDRRGDLVEGFWVTDDHDGAPVGRRSFAACRDAR